MPDATRRILVCCLGLIAALWGVGAVVAEPLRHFVQSLPIWAGVALGARKSALSKWVALPLFAFWLFLMGCIWLFLLGWARIVSGAFSPAEIALTVAIGAVCLAGIVSCLRFKTTTRAPAAIMAVVLSAALQCGALAASLMPAIARR